MTSRIGKPRDLVFQKAQGNWHAEHPIPHRDSVCSPDRRFQARCSVLGCVCFMVCEEEVYQL